MNIVLNGLKVTQDRIDGNHIADCLAGISFCFIKTIKLNSEDLD